MMNTITLAQAANSVNSFFVGIRIVYSPRPSIGQVCLYMEGGQSASFIFRGKGETAPEPSEKAGRAFLIRA